MKSGLSDPVGSRWIRSQIDQLLSEIVMFCLHRHVEQWIS